jgi:hypothetical protein
LKTIRGPLFGLFLAAIDAGDNKAAAAISGRLHENLALGHRTAFNRANSLLYVR